MRKSKNRKEHEGREPSGDTVELERKLGHTFADPSLLRTALTHPSYANEVAGEPNYERLEFLGDAILNMLVALDLFSGFPEMDQGRLTQARASLVNEGCLATVARELDLGRFLRLAKGEHFLGGRDKASILSDTFEALLAAVFLDGGVERAAELVRRLLGPLYPRAASGELGGDLKTAVNDLVWRRFHEPPAYVHISRSGPPHEPTFVVELRLGERTLGRGRGRSKKEAEQEAARAALAELEDVEAPGETRDGGETNEL